MDQKELVGYMQHPFYERNRIQTFLAFRGGEVLRPHRRHSQPGPHRTVNERRGFFGFFDCIDDQEVADGLLDAVRQWFADQGIYCLRGPANPSLNYEVGLLVDGFDSPPTFMMTYNPPYYARLMENYGFRKTQDLYAFWGHMDMLPKIQAKLRPLAEQIIERYDVTMRPLDKTHFLRDVRDVPVDLQSFAGQHLGLRAACRRPKCGTWPPACSYLIVPELAMAAEIDGQVVGGTFGLPDYNPRISEIDGRLVPLRLLPPAAEQAGHQDASASSATNVLPEYQRLGMAWCLMHGLVPKAHGMGHGRGRVLLGAGVQFALPRQPGERRGEDHQDLSAL